MKKIEPKKNYKKPLYAVGTLLLVGATAISGAGCGGPQPTTPTTTTEEVILEGEMDISEPTEESTTETTEFKLVNGTLYCLNLREGLDPDISAAALTGNIGGSTEFNTAQPTNTGIRSVFELNEWIDIYLDTVRADNLQVWVLKHSDDLAAYQTLDYSEEMEGFVVTVPLAKPETDGDTWGSFYLNPDEVDPGTYDLVFTYKGLAVAVVSVDLYQEGTLNGKTDDELRTMMG